jgi:SAM-dependent methyltransferase
MLGCCFEIDEVWSMSALAKSLQNLPAIVPKELWDREYTSLRSIPSSSREEPAKALVLFSELMSLSAPAKVLDAGCGNGRNAIYLARRGCRVAALDFSEAALAQVQSRVRANRLEGQVSTIKHAIDDPLPFEKGSFDAVLDCYTFCHFLADDAAESFWNEMHRVTRPSGFLLSLVFSPQDSYYAQYNTENSSIVRDPSNGIWKRLYTEKEIKAFFARQFLLRYFAKFEFEDIVHGSPYRRVILASVLQKQL